MVSPEDYYEVVSIEDYYAVNYSEVLTELSTEASIDDVVVYSLLVTDPSLGAVVEPDSISEELVNEFSVED